MAKKPAPIYVTNFGLLAYAYIAKPDDTAPEGVSWKPDGKFKGSLVFDNEADVAELRDTLIAGLRAQFPQAPGDDELILPIKPGEAMSGKKAEQLAGKMVLEAKSDYKPKVWDSLGGLCPEGVTARSGDTVRFKVSPYYFSKDEKVIEKVGNKRVESTITVYGASLRLAGVQIKRKGGGGDGGDGGGFDAVEDGEFDASTAERDTGGGDTPSEKPTRRAASGADF